MRDGQTECLCADSRVPLGTFAEAPKGCGGTSASGPDRGLTHRRGHAHETHGADPRTVARRRALRDGRAHDRSRRRREPIAARRFKTEAANAASLVSHPCPSVRPERPASTASSKVSSRRLIEVSAT